ncbi:SDR family NAD(P)-dependent oxidoreductase [Nitrospirillum sp. BR 11828]|uniref:SDR family NAD(P)-dependent oxidoreductase n=1 Tax=Nitrospirillum sp. BR 11828 TaxID=3104325 RepID=UPI002ACA8280|nr:SDR family NAD(P)-dependent oxidoreductase [Nitrospirillum sp. BR 11828]MDZ5647848.1 SDR family NAD(P)-dependent oxidoreductase [Nitrospirillum sp. BR 11828]
MGLREGGGMAGESGLAPEGCAVVVGAGGLGRALASALTERGAHAQVLLAGRREDPPCDITNERAVAALAARVWDTGAPLHTVIVASGFLHGPGPQPYQAFAPEKTWRQLDPAHLAHAFAVNAIGPALLAKHLLPLFPASRRCVFAALSAKVGSIGDNATGGWYGYRASKAALNQIIRTAAVELARTRPLSLCVAVHPGTVDTPLSAPFAKTGLDVRPPDRAAAQILDMLDRLHPDDTGRFFAYDGRELPW